MYIPF